MKKLYFLLIGFSFCLTPAFAQTGPGGVGNSSNNIIWLDANRLSYAVDAEVDNFEDFSGNNNHATQATSSARPSFKQSVINGNSVVDFDGTDDFLEFGTHLTNDAISMFIVYKNENNSGIKGLLTTEKHLLFANNSQFTAVYANPVTYYNISKTLNTFSVTSLKTNADLSGSTLTLTDGNSASTPTRAEQANKTVSYLGVNQGATSLYFEGQIAEVILFNEELNTASMVIIGNYLAGKYDLTPAASRFAYRSTHGNGIVGIGQESDGSNTSAMGIDSLLMNNPSSLGNSEYLLVGHDGAGLGQSTSVPSGVVRRWNQVWRADVTGSPGTVDLEFFIGTTNTLAPSETSSYTVLIESVDGDFTNGGTSVHSTGLFFDGTKNSIKFTGVNLADGDYFTLAALDGAREAIADGAWNSTATWNCTCIPADGDIVTIPSTMDVTIGANAAALNLTVASGGSLTFSGADTLSLSGAFAIEGTTSFGSGTVQFTGTGSESSVTNTSGSTVAFGNVYINSSNGASFGSGDWSVSGNLQVSSGGMDVSSATSFTMLSTASQTSQIMESMDNAFTGNFTLHRYIGTRNANYSNWSSPTSDGTVGDWDDDIFMSGVGGVDGNATYGGSIWYSVYLYNWFTDVNFAVTTTTQTLEAGKGVELYLGTNTFTYNGGTIDMTGSPNNGDISTALDRGWTLLGNPYHSFIDFDAITSPDVFPSEFYIFNTDNGSYDFFTGGSKPNIAPWQGFWIFKASGTLANLTIHESGKVNSTSSDFLRKRNHQPKEFTLGITSMDSSLFNHKTLIDFGINSTAAMDENDAPFLASPLENVPAIYSTIGTSEKLVKNSLPLFEETQVVPIEVYTGVDGKYEINAENINSVYENYSCVYLKDKADNKLVDLSVESNYSFESDKGTHSRFDLILSNSYDECKKVINNDVVQKLDRGVSLRNSYGDWYIDYNVGSETTQFEVKVYNTAGQLVKDGISFSSSNIGYERITGLNELNGIFIVQIKTNDLVVTRSVNL